ncbi:MAG: hypothetical protein GXX86_11420 [Propionibacterium sp.]|nr:hypothetical protein [Propionibacterium sp.]
MTTTFLHRFTVKPKHLDDYLPIWHEQRRLRAAHGFVTHRAFVETDAEPKVTWLYSHPDPEAGLRSLAEDAATDRLADRAAPHVFRNLKIRPVRVHRMTGATAESVAGRIAIMRRYAIVGAWPEFLEIWKRIVPVREKYGFRCLFAVADEPEDMFTWAFDFAGRWQDFPAAQRGYYRDPARVELRGVFDYMADYSIHPAEQILIPTE